MDDNMITLKLTPREWKRMEKSSRMVDNVITFGDPPKEKQSYFWCYCVLFLVFIMLLTPVACHERDCRRYYYLYNY